MTLPIEILPWDSRFFGLRVARYREVHLTPARARAAIKACLAQRVKCLYFLAASQDAPSIACAESEGFRLADVRVTFTKDVDLPFTPRPRSPGAQTLRPARPADTKALQRLARTLFPESRFAVDPGFPSGAHEKLFSTWIAKSVRGHFDHWVGVAEDRGRLAGFISCRRTKRRSGLIGLIGVAKGFRRRGLGRALMDQGLEWFGGQNIRHLSVVTQGRAVGAQRLYQACGFRTSHVDLWYHKWF